MPDEVGIFADGLPTSDVADRLLALRANDQGISDLVIVDTDALLDSFNAQTPPLYNFAAGGPVDVLSTSNITLSGEQTIDGVTTSASRVGVIGQSAAANNGIYVSGSGAWTRATDADSALELSRIAFSVLGGSNADKEFGLNLLGSAITLGTTELLFTELRLMSGLAAETVRAKAAEALKANLDFIGVKGGNPPVFGYGGALDGASLIYDESTINVVGISIAAGQIGNNSFFNIQAPLYQLDFARLAGATLEFTVTMNATAGFLSSIFGFVDNAVETPIGSGNHVGNVISTAQVGTVITRIVQYTVTGSETSLAVVLQIGVGGALGADASIQFADLSWRVVTGLATDAAQPGAGSIYESIKKFAAPRTGINCFNEIVPNPEALNGASLVTQSDGRVLGWSIPAGETGNITFIEYCIPVSADIALIEKAWVRIKLGFQTSADYPAGLLAQFKLKDAAGDRSFATNATVTQTQLSSTRRVIEFVGQVVASPAPAMLAPLIQHNANVVLGSSITISLTDAVFEIISNGSDTRTPGDDNTYLAAKRTRRVTTQRALGIAAGPRADGYDVSNYVESGGSGDYTSISAALTAITDADFTRRYELRIATETFTDFNFSMKDFVDLRGMDRFHTIVAGAQPNNAALTDIANNSTINCVQSARLADLYATAQNCRYVLHCDYAFGVNPNRLLEIFDCHFEHLGNAGARAYQTSIGGDPDGVWPTELAVGYGFSSGVEMRFERCTFIGGYNDFNGHAVTGHDQVGMTAPGKMVVRNSRLIVRNANSYSFTVGCGGSLLMNAITLDSNEMNAPIVMSFTPWQLTDAPSQLANKIHFDIRGARNSPVPFVMLDEGSRALRIDSASTGLSSSVVISGSAAPVLFGNVITVAGDAGLSGGAYGTWDIGDHLVGLNLDHAITKLGYRLGNCTSAHLTLAVAIDGGAVITINFNTDYSSMSNAAIEGIIQAALGSAGTVSEFNVNDLYRPSFMDEEIYLQNNDATTIKRKTAVKFDGTPIGGKVMTQSDAAALFAGIAYEDIRPGQWGRVKTRGCVRVGMDMIRSDSGAFAAGTNFGVGSVAGEFVASPSIALLQAINTADVRWLAATKPFG